MLSRASRKMNTFTAARMLQAAGAKNFASDTTTDTAGGGLAQRLRITAEVTVSKLFPAGFAWQGGSILAENMGMGAETAGFAVTTGFTDACGVCLGHVLFYSLAKNVYLPGLDMDEVKQTGLLLGSAAFFSGGLWQPLQNFTIAQGMSFTPAALFVGGGCTMAFFAGLKIWRAIYPALGLSRVAKNSPDNFGKDLQLSVSIGGAGAAFVGTCAGDYIVAGADTNWLRPIVGVEDGMSNLTGMTLAGSSTAIGFSAYQMVQNLAWPRGQNWTD